MLAAILGWFAIAASAYYLVLYALAAVRLRRPREGDQAGRSELVVVLVPARDEELVIRQTVERALALEGDPVVVVLDDGSSDRTAEEARGIGDHPRLVVERRSPEEAGRGKGDVLNAGVALVARMVAAGDPRMRGRRAQDVVVCILDADGWLEQRTLRHVLPLFDDPRVGGVQVSVRMWNARSGFLARMQDIEFAAYGNLFQAGRDMLGSVLMGGNGQFVRLAALLELGRRPWSDCLTEDLDIGLRLMRRGWRLRACPHAFVAQQAIGTARPFLRQRTRWVQGHLTCWRHLPGLWNPRSRLPLVARADLSLHLLLGLYGLLAACQVLLVTATATGLVSWRSVLPVPPVAAAGLVLVLMLVPIGLVARTYQRHAEARVPRAATAGVFAAYCAYHYLWSVPATAVAIARLALRRTGWTKTRRAHITHHDLAAAAAAEGRA